MTRVMAVGVFDLIHPGHLHYLQQARGLGDELVVVIARDRSVERRKHTPIQPEAMRLELVAALKPVDRAVLGHEDDQYKTVEEIRPGVIALGYDDYHNADDVRRECAERGIEVEVVRIGKKDHDLAGTRKLIRRIFDSDRYKAWAAEDARKGLAAADAGDERGRADQEDPR